MSASGDVDLFDAIHDTVFKGVHHYKYRNGAFTDKIFRETPAVDAINILINSEETPLDHKITFESIRKLYLDFPKFSVSQPTREDLIGSFMDCQAFSELFPNLAKARDMYVAPSTFQVMNEDGTVKETHVVNDDGSTSVYQGGVTGVPPGAPNEWVAAQAKNTEMLNEASKNSPAQVILGNRFRPEAIPSGPKEAGTANNTGYLFSLPLSRATTDVKI
jgi:hypothetical protein